LKTHIGTKDHCAIVGICGSRQSIYDHACMLRNIHTLTWGAADCAPSYNYFAKILKGENLVRLMHL